MTAGEQLVALLRGPWGWRAKWQLYAGAATALVGLVVAFMLVVPGGGGSTDQLLAEDPTPTATLDGAATPTSSPNESATTVPKDSTEPPRTTPKPSAEPTFAVSADAMLSDRYIADTFGGGLRAAVRGQGTDHTTPERESDFVMGGQHSCLQWLGEGVAPLTSLASREWSWPGETVAAEHLAEAESLTSAQERFAICADPTAKGFDRDYPTLAEAGHRTTRSLDLGDEAYLATVRRSLETSAYAGARKGSFLVVVTWRVSGSVPTTDALERVLGDALRNALGQEVGSSRPAADVTRDDELQGFPTRDTLPEVYTGQESLIWQGDLRWSEPMFPCPGGEVSLATEEPPITRGWSAVDTFGNSPATVRIALARAAAGGETEASFDACRKEYGRHDYEVTDMEDLGDDAFVAWDWTAQTFPSSYGYARVGSHYIEVDGSWLSTDDLIVVLRAAVDSFAAAGRLS